MKLQTQAATVSLIRDRMRERNIKTRDLAARIQLSEGFLRAVLAGRKRLPFRIDTLERIAGALDIQPDLLDGYRHLSAMLSPEVIQIRDRMRHLGMTPEDLHDQLAGSIQLPYLRSLLTGGCRLPRRSPVRSRLESLLGLTLGGKSSEEPQPAVESGKLPAAEVRYLTCLIDTVILAWSTEDPVTTLLGPSHTDLVRERLMRLPDNLLQTILRLELRVHELSRIAKTRPGETIRWLLREDQPERHPIARSLLEHLEREHGTNRESETRRES